MHHGDLNKKQWKMSDAAPMVKLSRYYMFFEKLFVVGRVPNHDFLQNFFDSCQGQVVSNVKELSPIFFGREVQDNDLINMFVLCILEDHELFALKPIFQIFGVISCADDQNVYS